MARDIARVLGAQTRGEGYLHGDGYMITWAVGHLASLAQPHEIRPEWKAWRRDLLPMLPGSWPLMIYPKTKDQFETVRKILCSPRVSHYLRYGCGARGRTDLPLYLRSGAFEKPVSASGFPR